MKKKQKKEETIGFVAVDSGQILLCDPCNIDDQWKKMKNYKQFLKTIGHEEFKGEFSYAGCCESTLNSDCGQLNFKKGHPGVGVVSSTGWGDGLYPVSVKRNKEGRIMEIKINFN